MKLTPLALSLALLAGSASATAAAPKPFLWQNATVYFMLTDRFNNANPSNDHAYGRKDDAAPLRGYMGGDLAGITAKIKDGYFDSLGVNVIWLTPPVEQTHDGMDEGAGQVLCLPWLLGARFHQRGCQPRHRARHARAGGYGRTRTASACCWTWC